MCASTATLAVFLAVLIVGFALTLTAFLTPGWRTVYFEPYEKEINKETVVDSVKKEDYSMGLVTHMCGEDAKLDKKLGETCSNNFFDKHEWELVVIGCMILALASQLLAFIWSWVVCYMCCCRKCLTPPLPIFAAISAAAIATAVVLFVINTGSEKKLKVENVPENWDEFKSKDSVGYSLWLAAAAGVVMLGDVIVAFVLHRSYDVPVV